MRTSSTLAALLSLSLTSVSAIQTIYVGTITGSDNIAHSAAWFSDSDPCQEATVQGVGWNGPNGQYCAQNWKLLSHDGISFTGCGSTDEYPISVLDGGNQALTCDISTQQDISCPSGSVNMGTVQPEVYCT